MTWDGLTGRQPDLPLVLPLADGSQLRIQQWLRILPDKRYVAKAEWQGRLVLVKLFVGKGACRHAKRELGGISRLQAAHITTPDLLHSQVDSQQACVITQLLEQQQTLSTACGAIGGQLTATQTQLIGQALALLSSMHQQGVWQADLHLDNWLLADDQLWVIDADSVKGRVGKSLSRRQALRNLALFVALLNVDLMMLLPLIKQHYHAVAVVLAPLHRAVQQVRRKRMQRHLRKRQRDTTIVKAYRDQDGRVLADRQLYDAYQLRSMLDAPDQALSQGVFYKQGNTAWVMPQDWHGLQLVLKRYNIKSWRHWLSRCWRPSRGWRSWLNTHRLLFLGIATPRVVAVKERRRFGLRSVAWLWICHGGDEDIVSHWQAWQHQGLPPAEELHGIVTLFSTLKRFQLSHGDLKGSNILWDGRQWQLIDLDSLRQMTNSRRFEQAFASDRARFLRNWAADSELYQYLNSHLPMAASA